MLQLAWLAWLDNNICRNYFLSELVIKDPFAQKLIYRRPGSGTDRMENVDGNRSPQSSRTIKISQVQPWDDDI